MATAAATSRRPLPDDENNPLANNADPEHLILWLAVKEAQSMLP